MFKVLFSGVRARKELELWLSKGFARQQGLFRSNAIIDFQPQNSDKRIKSFSAKKFFLWSIFPTELKMMRIIFKATFKKYSSSRAFCFTLSDITRLKALKTHQKLPVEQIYPPLSQCTAFNLKDVIFLPQPKPS